MDWSDIWPVVAVALGGGGFLTVSIQELAKFNSGRAHAERQHNRTLKRDAEQALAERDWAHDCRRIVAEKAAKWRRIAIEHGVTEEALGPWPRLPAKPRPEDDDEGDR